MAERIGSFLRDYWGFLVIFAVAFAGFIRFEIKIDSMEDKFEDYFSVNYLETRGEAIAQIKANTKDISNLQLLMVENLIDRGHTEFYSENHK